jgi:hypothetical protein
MRTVVKMATARRPRVALLIGAGVGAVALIGGAVAMSETSSIDGAAIASLGADRVDLADRTVVPLPGGASFDYQIGGDYDPPSGVDVVSRDWFIGSALEAGYSICYVNAFQTQPDGDGSRPDERSQWPTELVLTGFEDDPNWDGEYLIDISTSQSRIAAADHLAQMIETCATKGFDAVEYDNLDAWTRLDNLPFDEQDTVEFATIITQSAHSFGLAVGQKNTAQLLPQRTTIGFDFAVVEECGEFAECDVFTDEYGALVVGIEYSDDGFSAACSAIGDAVSVVRRDLFVTLPGSDSYVFDEC